VSARHVGSTAPSVVDEVRAIMPRFELHHVQLAIPPGGEAQARAFFGEVLGLVELAKPPALAARGGCWFATPERGTSGAGRDGLELHLGVEDPFQPARKAHPGIVVADLDDVAARLTAAGHEVQPDDLFPGYRRIYTSDPFGNRLEFLEPEAGNA
jgi:catechol 2,3-dioxygenase-like lactoylglutathione lyase family enzyme